MSAHHDDKQVEDDNVEDLTLMIDNYDSFTYNIYQDLSSLGANVKVYRNDELTLSQCIKLNPSRLVISPGPGHPSSAGVSLEALQHFQGRIPILGVCLGHQAIFEMFGGTVARAVKIMHGKTSLISHDGRGLYAGIPCSFHATRYHSLVGLPHTLPDSLIVTSWVDECEQRTIMGVRHRRYVIESVQFHPESITTEHGKTMLQNFLNMTGGEWSAPLLKLYKKCDNNVEYNSNSNTSSSKKNNTSKASTNDSDATPSSTPSSSNKKRKSLPSITPKSKKKKT